VTVAVIFTSTRAEGYDDEYAATAERMEELAAQQPGYEGIVSVRDPVTRFGITVSYWADDESARRWRAHPEHVAAQQRGHAAFYLDHDVVVAEVVRGAPPMRP
jgi:heme-degrading monooxygenase HmoA